MPHRTIAQARSMLEQAAPSINSEMFRRYSQEVVAAEAEATASAAKLVEQTHQDFITLRDELLQFACDIREEQERLSSEYELGELTARQYHERYEQLDADKRRLSQRSDKLLRDQEFVAQIEADPVAWTDQNIYAKFPHALPEFSF